MSATDPRPQGGGWRAWLRTPVGLGVVVLVVLVVFLVARHRGGGEAGAAFGQGGTNAIDCVTDYPAGLGQADFAFDGVATGRTPLLNGPLTELGYRGVSFEVREWFGGGTGTEVTVAMPQAPTDGARLLVAGGIDLADGGSGTLDPGAVDSGTLIAWQQCGFVRYFDPDVADTWRTTHR